MRIIVKNLPINVTEDYLKNEFSKISVLTDLSFPKNNKRNFCFVGYKTKEDAEKAVKYFNKSYIKNCKLVVELVNDDYIEKRRKLNEMIGKSECNEKEKYVESVSLQIFGLPRYDTCSTKAKKDLKGEKINDTDINQENTKKSLNSVITKKDIKNEFENVKNVTYDEDKCVVVFNDLQASIKAQSKKILFGKRVKYVEYIQEDKEKYYNSLFFDFKTVVERICAEENISKEDLVDVDDNDLGARIAILETHLVDQTKKWLDENNIDVKGEKIDKKMLLIRNYDLLNNLSGLNKGKIKVSPSKCLAIVEFNNEKDCEEAYKRFCMKRVKDKAIYCEFVPVKEIKEEVENRIRTNKVIVKNIPFQASVDEIKKIIESQVKVIEIRMPIKRDGTKRGFCFVELENEECVKYVCEYFGQSTHLYGRRLIFIPAEQ
ncbi:hypothetical protein BDAP_002410 [Binucleata daphniae]